MPEYSTERAVALDDVSKKQALDAAVNIVRALSAIGFGGQMICFVAGYLVTPAVVKGQIDREGAIAILDATIAEHQQAM